MLKKPRLKMVLVVLIIAMMGAACSSETQMYKHRRSHCDCPTF